MNIDIYIDSSCAGNPGVGGYAAVLESNGHERIVKGTIDEVVSNNFLVLTAMKESIVWVNEKQKKPCNITIHTTSDYIIKCALGRNEDGTKRKVGWFKDRQNGELWFQIINAVVKGKHTVKFEKVSTKSKNKHAQDLAKEERLKASHKLLEV